MRSGGLIVAILLTMAAGGIAACDGGNPDGAAPVATATALAAAAVEAPAPRPPGVTSSPPPRTQDVGLVAALGDEGSITVVHAEAAPAGYIRLLIAFQIAQPGWASDATPAAIQSIHLTDERGRRVPLVAVTGSTAANDSSSTSLDGWYTFGPLTPGARRVSLTYPVYEDGSQPIVVRFDLGVASPALTPAALAGIWRTALVSEPSPPSGVGGGRRAAWDYERIEFLADGRLLIFGPGDARARQGSFDSANGVHLSITTADGDHLAYSVDEFSPERLVLARTGQAGTEWLVLTRQ